MGQAKTRGSRETRVAEAAAQARKARAPALSCKLCQARPSDLMAMDVAALPGIEVAYQAHCAACDQDTWAVRGEPAAVRAFFTALEKSAGQRVELGTAKPVAE